MLFSAREKNSLILLNILLFFRSEKTVGLLQPSSRPHKDDGSQRNGSSLPVDAAEKRIWFRLPTWRLATTANQMDGPSGNR